MKSTSCHPASVDVIKHCTVLSLATYQSSLHTVHHFFSSRLDGYFYHDEYIGKEPNEKIKRRMVKKKANNQLDNPITEQSELRYHHVILLSSSTNFNDCSWFLTLSQCLE
jgi:hypothetical protein